MSWRIILPGPGLTSRRRLLTCAARRPNLNEAKSRPPGGGDALDSSIEFRVRYSETDQMGVVYHTNYLVWCEMGRTELMRGLGTTYAEMERQGIFLVVSEAVLRYRSSARYDDPIRVRTRLGRLRSRSVRFHYRVERADDSRLLAEAETELVCVDRDSTPRKLPEEIRGLLQQGLEAGPPAGTGETSTGDRW
ncbi:MAG: acyl-CoA thioesterase [Gemmatimonadota bacterium]|nr:MAG: acyl-CoA thioesterase [Gemmatimonadota bacterium]